MAVESENIQTLMEWLARNSPVRSAVTCADALAEKLAAVVFQGDTQWTDRPDQADGYRDALGTWLATDSGHEQQFAALTAPHADPTMFVDWFLPVVAGWESLSAGQQSTAGQNGGDSADVDPGRYSEPARDEGYGLTYRYDHQAGAYEWYDEDGQTWRDQTWADQRAASGSGATTHAPSSEPGAGPAPEWDENWKMFYRVDAGGAYQFADAVTPGDKSSGWAENWLSREQVVARTAGSSHAKTHSASAPQAGSTHAQQPARSAQGQQDSALSGAHWAALFPSLGNDITHLDGDFGPRVGAFITAMKDAGIEVVVVGARRSPERAYLMHWSYEIYKNGVSAQHADQAANKHKGVAIRWEHTDANGAYDPKASLEGAKSLYHALNVAENLAVAPALTSNHITGRAVDMTAVWHKDSITIRMADGTDAVITTTGAGERTDDNPDLHKVGESYGVIHFASEKGAKTIPAGDRNHWSYNGH